MSDPATPETAVSTPFELDLMADAVRYQRWLIDSVRPALGKRILEVGAGVGTMTRWLRATSPTELIATEPDPGLRAELARRAGEWGDPPVEVGAYDPVADGSAPFEGRRIDTVVSFNVLEHIADDRAALVAQAEVLERSGAPGPRRLIVFAPAHQWAYGEIDRAFEHHRRYGRRRLERLVASAAPTATVRVRFFNTFGLPGWFLIGRVLRRSSFGLGGVHAMERLLPVLRPIDDALHARGVDLPLGQSVLAVAEWR